MIAVFLSVAVAVSVGVTLAVGIYIWAQERHFRRTMSDTSRQQQEALREIHDNLQDVTVGELDALNNMIESAHPVRSQQIIRIKRRVH